MPSQVPYLLKENYLGWAAKVGALNDLEEIALFQSHEGSRLLNSGIASKFKAQACSSNPVAAN